MIPSPSAGRRNRAIGRIALVSALTCASLYAPLFSSVFWDVQDVMLEDVERIEVISGPGGTLWGVNAVNGVINIITRSAKNTQGGLLAAGGGNRKAIGALRYGGEAGPDGRF